MVKSKNLSYKPIQPVKNPKMPNSRTNQQRFWHKYLPIEIKSQKFINQQAQSIVNCVAANSNDEQLMLFGHGRNVTMVSTATHSIVKQFTNFDNNVTCAAFRADGMVIALGDESGKIQVMDSKQKFRLRTFKNHKKRVNCLDFHGHDLYSGGEDMILRLFDVAAGAVIHSYENANDDYIRCVRGLQQNHVLSAGYDGKIKLFDFRVHKAAQRQFQHGIQVQHIDILPSKLSFVACGENKISLWDIRNCAKALLQNSGNKKVVNCVKVAIDGSRILSSSYDSYFKVYKSDSFQVTYQQKMNSPIVAFDISKDNFCVGFGLENRKIILKARSSQNKVGQQFQNQSQNQLEVEKQIALWLNKNQHNISTLNRKYFYRGIYRRPQSFQIKFERRQNKILSEYDKCLKKFHYKKALLISVRKKNMAIMIALIDQYVQRGCLDRTIKSMSSNQLQQLIPFFSKLIPDVRYNKISLQILSKITQYHENSQSSKRLFVFNQLKQRISEQLRILQHMKKLNGMLELIQKNCI